MRYSRHARARATKLADLKLRIARNQILLFERGFSYLRRRNIALLRYRRHRIGN